MKLTGLLLLKNNELNALRAHIAHLDVIDAFKDAKTIFFNSNISVEEAIVLQILKEKFAYKLVNKEVKKYQNFLQNFSKISGKSVYSASLNTIKESDFIITLGYSILRDNPEVTQALNVAYENKKACITYMHPLEAHLSKEMISQYVKYEVGSEEGILAMLSSLIVDGNAQKIFQNFFNEIDEGYICGESSVGEEEFLLINKKLKNKNSPVLIIGQDLYNHESSENIAKLIGMIEKYSDISIYMVLPKTYALDIAMFCDLDDTIEGKTIGYKVNADFILSEKIVTDCLKLIPSGVLEFDNQETAIDNSIDDINELHEYNGAIVYRYTIYNHEMNQKEELCLEGSKQFATAAKIRGGNMVRFEMDGMTYERKFKINDQLKGTIALNPTFESTHNYDEYRYKQVKVEVIDV